MIFAPFLSGKELGIIGVKVHKKLKSLSTYKLIISTKQNYFKCLSK